MLRVGLTGGIGAGKSIVAKVLRSMGYPVFDSDSEAKHIMNDDPMMRSELIAIFGDEVYTKDGLNRPFLAQKIFNDESLKDQVNGLVHPAVRAAFEKQASAADSGVIFNEAAILFETGANRQFDAMVLVSAPEALRIQRVMARDNASEDAVKARIRNQWSDEKKRELTDFEIVNDQVQPLVMQVEEMLKALLARK